MLLQYEELLLKRRHPDYRPLSLDWNHKLLPRSASVRLCYCVHVSVCVCVCMYWEQRPRLQTWMEHKMASCFPSLPNVPTGASVVMTGATRPVSSPSFLLPSTLQLLFFCCLSVCSTHALPPFSPPHLYYSFPTSIHSLVFFPSLTCLPIPSCPCWIGLLGWWYNFGSSVCYVAKITINTCCSYTIAVSHRVIMYVIKQFYSWNIPYSTSLSAVPNSQKASHWFQSCCWC